MSAKLFSAYTVKNVTLKNRIVMSPMCMYSCMEEDGLVQNWHRTHYPSRAVGGVGLVFTEATAVTAQGRISPQDLGIWSDEHVEGLAELVSLIKEQGSKTGIQLAHAGRKSEVREEIIAPSALAFNEEYKTPREMTKQDIQETIEAFKKAAERAKKAGFDIIELHGAHGYLINQFLSPLSNKRTDEYGGSAQNRYRILKETIAAVKEVWDGPLFTRLSAHDYHEEGMTAELYVEIASWMKEDGVDLIDVSSGALVPAQIKAYPGYQVPFSETIKHGANIDTSALGLITTGIQAEEILQNNRADLIFLARALLRDPYWARSAAKEVRHEIEAPVQYRRAW
ncbi:NADPH dehydrogenase NamA [Peribacillus cavernae]|uniref:NADPH dehydrogenase n=1 Tax=Peribacillus cavernae TaxID=1674310 RepID=A0A3S0VV97_9BACI|nr:NADPH dehydrogenase NamA [Peribacillus cavernae]MDQ0219079.1 NADPH2 dehydrogenase [Peribacillus cavernae]RUQ26530.1 NADPH dehydrogenase NamA [Peribacillus cavernae]